MNSEYSTTFLKAKVDEQREFWNIFMKSLLKSSSRDLDAQVAPIVKEVSGRINCRECANCCSLLEPGISDEELKTLAALKQLPEEDFRNTYTETENRTGILFLKHTPCIFLEGKDCSIYACKPMSCSTFPGLERKGLKYRLRRVFSHLSLCPIIYHTFITLYQRHYDGKLQPTSE